jgi:peptidoglycan/xylan/chitin deacetylase (PgdA/CDA1 family)
VSASLLQLTFHGLGDAPAGTPSEEARRWVDPERADAIMALVSARSDVAVTFDDGLASDLDVALPLLRRHRLRASFFVVAGLIGAPGHLDADGVRQLRAEGMEVGNHGMRHRSWRGLDDAGLREELVQARRSIEETLGTQVRAAACPFSRYDGRVLRALRRAGYQRVMTSDGGRSDPRAWLQPRNTVLREHEPGQVAAWNGAEGGRLAPVKRALKRLR